MEPKEITLPSGATLKLLHTPFSESKELYQAILEELKGVPFSSDSDHIAVLKDLFCAGFASKKVEVSLTKCIKRCLYNATKIDKLDEIFDSEKAREDYSIICIEVAMENIRPFMKGLYAGFERTSLEIPGVPK